MISGSFLQTIVGRVVKRKLGKGSQPERLVNAVQTEDGRSVIVRHSGTTAFEDNKFDKLQGKQVQITGIFQSFVLIAEEIKEIENINNSASLHEQTG